MKRLEELPFPAKFFLKRLLVGAVGAGVRLAAAAVELKRRLVRLAVRHGLNFERAWQLTPEDYRGAEQLPPLGARDFLLLADATRATEPARTDGRAVRVSVVIPVFNKADYTFQCLRSLLAEMDFDRDEVIVVDDASSDETARLLAHFDRFVRVVTNDENLGFVGSCNRGAAAARGRYLLFLNNDTIVQPGWLEALVETAEADERVGAVGSLFLYPSGVVQEAGSIVWRDGAAHHYGWGGSPGDHRYAFAREVDYCSGASLLIAKDLFDEIGGFDARYSPAYYEDVDLCFEVRARGRRVVYQPASRVVHFEGVTAGTDTSAGVKHFQVVNQKKFFDKWRETLEREHFGKSEAVLERAANRKRAGPQVVVFDERVPTPDRDAGSARMFFILRSLARWSHVVFVPMSRPRDDEYERRLWRAGIETASLVEYPRLLAEREFAAAVFSRPPVADALLERVRRQSPRSKIVFDMVDVYFIRLGREYEVGRDEGLREEAERHQEMETRLARASDLVWCNSVEDRRVMERLAPGVRIEVIPTIHEPRDAGPSFDERNGLLFLGNLIHRPNADGVHFLMREVFPVVRARLPGVPLAIVGDNTPAEIAAYNGDGVRVTGYVPDVEPFFAAARVFVAPVRFGAGVKGKIGEALAHGLPVVTTPVGAEGMGLEDEASAMIAADAEAFADAVVRLHTDPALWRRVAEAGRGQVERHFSPRVVEEIVNAPLKELIGGTVEKP